MPVGPRNLWAASDPGVTVSRHGGFRWAGGALGGLAGGCRRMGRSPTGCPAAMCALLSSRVGIGAVGEFLAQVAQRSRVQPGNPPAAHGACRTHSAFSPQDADSSGPGAQPRTRTGSRPGRRSDGFGRVPRLPRRHEAEVHAKRPNSLLLGAGPAAELVTLAG